MRDRLIIAIDGPVGAGKSTAGQSLARRLGYRYIDSGAMYRALAWKSLQVGLDLEDEEALRNLAEGIDFGFSLVQDRLLVMVDGQEVSQDIRARHVEEASSKVSAFAGVRTVLVARQREMARHGGVVMDGRDIGTAVFPDADVKFFLDARLQERANRRYREVAAAGGGRGWEELAEEIRVRDARDTNRTASPLRRAVDAVAIDTTDMDPWQVVEMMAQAVRQRIESSGDSP